MITMEDQVSLAQTQLREIMSHQLITIKRNDCLDHVEAIFEKHKIHHLPVIDRDGQLTGLISQTDFERLKHGSSLFRIANREEYNRTLFRMTRVADVMTKDLIILAPFDSLMAAYRIFKKNRFRAIPIVEKGVLVGIVTPLDLLDFFVQNAS